MFSVIGHLEWKLSYYTLVLCQKLHIWTYDRQNFTMTVLSPSETSGPLTAFPPPRWRGSRNCPYQTTELYNYAQKTSSKVSLEMLSMCSLPLPPTHKKTFLKFCVNRFGAAVPHAFPVWERHSAGQCRYAIMRWSRRRRGRDGLCNNELTRVDTRRCFSSDVARVVRTDDRVEPPTDFIPPHSQFFFILLSTTSVKRPRRIAGHVDSTRTKRFRLHVPRFERIDVTYVCKYIVHSLYILIFIVF